MNSFKTISVVISLIFYASLAVTAQNLDITKIKSEIQEASLKEQKAFKEGNCDQVLQLMANEITYLANGRKVPSKEIIAKFCNSIPRPFKKADIDTLEIYPISNESGYTIRTLEYPNDEKTKMQEYVTKIWKKSDGEWKIIHLHSTVKEVPISE